jgi:Glucodextranase, domain B/PASTA domain
VFRAVLIALVALGVAGCGSGEPTAPPPKVRLAVTAPSDAAVVDGDDVAISGTVTPARAHVEVGGREVSASGGRFTASVPLDPGANVIDVAASADGRSPSVTAIRVVRQMPVQIPDLAGARPDSAVQRLEALGLHTEVQEGGSILDEIFGGEKRVCGSNPDAGETVRPGTTVTLHVERSC